MPETNKITCDLRQYSPDISSVLSTECSQTLIQGRPPCGNCQFAQVKLVNLAQRNVAIGADKNKFPRGEIYEVRQVDHYTQVVIRRPQGRHPYNPPEVLRISNGHLT